MDMNRKRPPKGCDLELWLSGTINDAMRDAREAGLSARMTAYIALTLARSEAGSACLSDDTIRSFMRLEAK